MHINSWEEVENHRCSHCEDLADEYGGYALTEDVSSSLSSWRAKCDRGCLLSMILLRCVEQATLQLGHMQKLRFLWFSEAIDGRKNCYLRFGQFREVLELILDSGEYCTPDLPSKKFHMLIPLQFQMLHFLEIQDRYRHLNRPRNGLIRALNNMMPVIR